MLLLLKFNHLNSKYLELSLIWNNLIKIQLLIIILPYEDDLTTAP